MGGRGAFYGGTQVMKYHEFKVVRKIGRIKELKPIKQNSLKTPTLSHSKNAIYATVRPDGKAKQITVYGQNREKLYEIDLDHDHSKGKLYSGGHVHYYVNGERSSEYAQPNRAQRKLIERFMKGIR
nr:MAG TPA: hypothetical protein [Caudoviricetes sp.]